MCKHKYEHAILTSNTSIIGSDSSIGMMSSHIYGVKSGGKGMKLKILFKAMGILLSFFANYDEFN